MRRCGFFSHAFLALLGAACGPAVAPPRPTPPPAPDLLAEVRAEGTSDDPYRALEGSESPAVAAWRASVDFAREVAVARRGSRSVALALAPGVAVHVEREERLQPLGEGEALPLHDLLAYGLSPRGPVALRPETVLAPGVQWRVPGLLPVAPVPLRQGLAYVRLPARNEVGFDPDGGPPRVFLRRFDDDARPELLFDETRPLDSLDLGPGPELDGEPTLLVRVRRGQQASAWWVVPGRPALRVATGDRGLDAFALGDRLLVVDDQHLRVALAQDAADAAAWAQFDLGVRIERAAPCGEDTLVVTSEAGPVTRVGRFSVSRSRLAWIEREPTVVDALVGDARGAYLLESHPAQAMRIVRMTAGADGEVTHEVVHEDEPRIPGAVVRVEEGAVFAFGGSGPLVVEALGMFGVQARARYRPEVGEHLARGGSWLFLAVPPGARGPAAERVRARAEAIGGASRRVYRSEGLGAPIAASAARPEDDLWLIDPVTDFARLDVLPGGLGAREELGADRHAGPYQRALAGQGRVRRLLVQLEGHAPAAHGWKFAAAQGAMGAEVRVDRTGRVERALAWLSE